MRHRTHHHLGSLCWTAPGVNGWAPEGEGLTYFIKTIPFNFYAWIALIVVPLIILGIIHPSVL